MREILFRGKLRDGRWAEGNLEVKKDGVCIITPDDTPLGCYGAVFPDTVGQYTGLTDKTGRKIFEGDILDVNGHAYAVRWDEGNVEFGIYNKCESIGIAYIGAFDTEVIGNIHDNPELLEGGATDG